MSTSKDQFPLPGDEVLYITHDPRKNPGVAWIYFTSGKFLEFPVWEENRPEEIPGHPGVMGYREQPLDPKIPKKEQEP